jgi:hypothetical protein
LERIASLLDSEYSNFQPPTGDIFSRYTIPTVESSLSNFDAIVNQTIETICQQVFATLQIEKNNEKLSAWTQVLGSFNQHGLVAHDKIKIREKKPRSGLFFENY